MKKQNKDQKAFRKFCPENNYLTEDKTWKDNVVPLRIPRFSSMGVEKQKNNIDIEIEKTIAVDNSECHPNVQEVSSYNSYPYTCVGKLFTNRKIFSTGVAIGQRYILTAAHNVVHPLECTDKDTIEFEPGFNPDYPTRTKEYPIECVYVNSGWSRGRDYHSCSVNYSRDLAILVTEEDMEIDSFLGIKTHLDKVNSWKLLGYMKCPNKRRRMYFDSGKNRTDIDCEGLSGYEIPGFRMSVCDSIRLTDGTSGGPWISENTKGEIHTCFKGKSPTSEIAPQYLSGLNSSIACWSNMMASPYFGDATKKFLDSVAKDLGIDCKEQK